MVGGVEVGGRRDLCKRGGGVWEGGGVEEG